MPDRQEGKDEGKEGCKWEMHGRTSWTCRVSWASKRGHYAFMLGQKRSQEVLPQEKGNWLKTPCKEVHRAPRRGVAQAP